MTKGLAGKKFVIILAVAVLMLCTAVWLNLKLGKNDIEDISGESGDALPTEESRETMLTVYGDYFNAFRTERSEVRAKEIEYLRSMINGENTDSDSLADAQTRLLELVGNMEKEFTIESRIRSKGFLDAAATLCSDSASIVVDGDSLTDEEVARILDIVMSETELPASAVKISLGG